MGYLNDGFGWRNDPKTGEKTWHNGVDYTTSTGVPITTNVPMTVVDANVQTGYGNIVTLKDDSGNTYKFAHLDKMNVRKGEKIPPDTLIGYVGNSGKSTGSHLHFEAANAAGKSFDPNSINPATGKLWTDVAGFKPGQTMNESIEDSDSDTTKFPRPRRNPNAGKKQPPVPLPDSTINDIIKKREQEKNKTGPGSNTRKRPAKSDVGILVNPRTRLGDGG